MRPARARGRRAQGGFTLLELLITLVISVFGLMGLIAAHASLSRGTATAGQSQEAVAIGTQTIETLRAMRTVDLARALTGSPLSAPPIVLDPYTSQLGRNGVTYAVAVRVTGASSTLWRLRVEVSWTADSETLPRVLAFEVLKPTAEAL